MRGSRKSASSVPTFWKSIASRLLRILTNRKSNSLETCSAHQLIQQTHFGVLMVSLRNPLACYKFRVQSSSQGNFFSYLIDKGVQFSIFWLERPRQVVVSVGKSSDAVAEDQ